MSDKRTEIDNSTKANRLPERIERKVRLSNLTEKQKSLIGAAGAGVAGVSLGVVAMSLMGAAEVTEGGEIKPPVTPGEGVAEVEVIIHADAPYADCVNDSMSFGEAFKVARDEVGSGGIFEWHGKLFNTYLKEEWVVMEKSERAEFFESIDKDFLPGDEDKEAEIDRIVNDTDHKITDTEDIVILYDDGPDDSVDDDDEIVVVDSDDDDIIILEQTDFDDENFGIPPDSVMPDFSADDILIIDEV